jgi:hypothetical protein
MKLEFPIKILRIWLLAVSVLALLGLFRTLSALLRDLQFSHDGVRTIGWITDLDSDERPFFHYAYVVKNVTYGGEAPLDDEKSDIYYRHPGDRIELTYLSKKPWISTRNLDPKWGLRRSGRWSAFYLGLFVCGVLLSTYCSLQRKSQTRAT